MSFPYVDHAYRHLAGGTDPIAVAADQPWLTLYFDDGVTTTTGTYSRLSYQSWARQNDSAGDYLYAETADFGTRYRAVITKQGIYMIQLHVVWATNITTGATTISLDSAAGSGLVGWDVYTDIYTQAFIEPEKVQLLTYMLHKYTDTDCYIDPRVKQNTGSNKDASSYFLKIVRMTDGGPSTSWDEGSI